MVEPAAAKVHAYMSYRTGGFVLCQIRQGIELPRFLVRSGAQNEFAGVLWAGQTVFLAETRQIQQFLMQMETVSDLAGHSGLALQRDGGEDGADTVPYRFVLQGDGLVRVPVASG